ncbi:MAG: tetratricopeptide repeat protein [Myxococcales bacterium]|nr:tetratricopeptide repeat protein [Myxococcales bacterium]
MEGLLAGTRGDLAMQREDFTAAVPLLEQTIRARSTAYGADEPDLARWLNRLASALSRVHRTDDATRALDRALAILEKHYGDRHPNVAVLHTTRGSIAYEAGDRAGAMASYRRSLEIKEATIGKAHPSLAPTLLNLAIVESDQAEHDHALEHARRAVTVLEAAMPPTHPRLAAALAVRGRMEVEARAWAEAAATLVRARAILEPLGDKPPLDETLRTLAMLRVHEGKLIEARELAERGLKIATAAYGPSLETAHAIADVARVQVAAGEAEAARTTFAQARDMARTAAGPNHPDVIALDALTAAR